MPAQASPDPRCRRPARRLRQSAGLAFAALLSTAAFSQSIATVAISKDKAYARQAVADAVLPWNTPSPCNFGCPLRFAAYVIGGDLALLAAPVLSGPNATGAIGSAWNGCAMTLFSSNEWRIGNGNWDYAATQAGLDELPHPHREGRTHAILVHRGGKAEMRFAVYSTAAHCVVFLHINSGTNTGRGRSFSQENLIVVLPLVGLMVFISAVADPIITDCLTAQRYRQLALRQMATPMVNGFVGFLLAHLGYGVYSLVFGLLVGHLIGLLSLVAGGHTGIGFTLDMGLIRNLMPIGKHIVLQRFFGFLVGQADSFIVGIITYGQAALNLAKRRQSSADPLSNLENRNFNIVYRVVPVLYFYVENRYIARCTLF